MTVPKTGQIVKFDYDMGVEIAAQYSNAIADRIDDNCKDCVNAFNSHMTALSTMISMTFAVKEDKVCADILARITMLNVDETNGHGERSVEHLSTWIGSDGKRYVTDDSEVVERRCKHGHHDWTFHSRDGDYHDVEKCKHCPATRSINLKDRHP